jgi:hypothetical protein
VDEGLALRLIAAFRMNRARLLANSPDDPFVRHSADKLLPFLKASKIMKGLEKV